jgi:hypothetical protein
MDTRAIAFPTEYARLDGYPAVPEGDGPHPNRIRVATVIA